GLTGPNGKRVEFINAGVDGYTSAQEYLYFVADLLRFKPDFVVVYDGWDDSVFDYESPFRSPILPNVLCTSIHKLCTDSNERLAASYSIGGSAYLLAGNLRYFLTESDFKLGMAELSWAAVHRLSHIVSRYLSYKSDAIQPEFASKPFD